MNKFVTPFLIFIVLSSVVYFSYVTALPKKKPMPVHRRDAGMELLVTQNQLEKEGVKLEDAFQFDLAKEKFKQAIEIGKHMSPRQDYGRPAAYYARVLQKEGKYEEALKEMNQLCEIAPQNEHFGDIKKELESLVKVRDLNNDLPIRQYIEFIKEKYAAGLPPKGYGASGMMQISTILRLYDTIGDYDAGIAYIDEILNWTYETDNEFKHLKGKINTSEEAQQCMDLGTPPKQRNPNSLACKWLREYLLVREAFEQDKAEGFKGCGGAKPGEACMGRATKALIQSDYFPW